MWYRFICWIIFFFSFFFLFHFCFAFVFVLFFLFRNLLIVGNLKMLSCNTVWGKVIEHCKSKASIYETEELAINVKYYLLTVVYHRSKRHFSHRLCYIFHSKGFPDGLCHSQDFIKKWTQENNDTNEGKSRQFAKYSKSLRGIEDRKLYLS